MKISATEMRGLFDLNAEPRTDARGSLVKTFEARIFAQSGLPTQFEEQLHTSSRRGVLRGMHFQAPPAGQAKVVYCHHGAIFDVVVDLRAGSPTFGRALSRELAAETGNGLFVPVGFAHGFVVTSSEAVVSYLLTSGYAPATEGGILWSSVGVAWPTAQPDVSDRDRAFPTLADFETPFLYESTTRGDT
jgi:dTDP-4-dehydrorhamnose 3,5-epimerase